jgi:hypothetical protein
MRLRALPLFILVAFVPACSSSPATLPPPDGSRGLDELAEVYKYRAAERMPAPASVEDLVDHTDAIPNAMQPIRDGEIVVVWRQGYAANSTAVLAYEKNAPTEGGKVLLRNGTVREMTAAEFKAAKK